jgi:hypothetical protein
MFKIILVYEPGGDFDKDDVLNMKQQLADCVNEPFEYVIISSDKSVATIVPDNPLVSWWCKLNMFSIKGPCLYIDLDVVLLRNIDDVINVIKDLTDKQIMMLTPFSEFLKINIVGENFSTSIMGWNGDMSYILNNFTREQLGVVGDQEYVSRMVYEHGIEVIRVDSIVKVVSWPEYKHLRCDRPHIINFYSNPRPRKLGLPYWGKHGVKEYDKK